MNCGVLCYFKVFPKIGRSVSGIDTKVKFILLSSFVLHLNNCLIFVGVLIHSVSFIGNVGIGNHWIVKMELSMNYSL